MSLLPTEKSFRAKELSEEIILIYGKPKMGKSTLASCFPNPIFLATEAGLNNLDVFKVNVNNWDKFINVCAELAEGKHNFKTIVIDTYDNLCMYATEYICKDKGIDDIGDYKKFGAYHLVTDLLRLKLNKLASLGYGLILISHATTNEIETKTRKYNMVTISVSGKNKDVALNLPDIILYMDSEIRDEKEVGVVRTKPSMYWHAGDKSKKLPIEIVYPLNRPEVVYEQLLKAFTPKETV